MALIVSHSVPLLFPLCQSSAAKLKLPSRLTRVKASAASGMDPQPTSERPRFKEFPYASPPIRDLMKELVSTVESRLGPQLLPCALPQDIQVFQDESGTNHGSLCLLPVAPPSPIDFILGSWLHCKLPTGGTLNISSLISYMNDSTDTPQLLVEFIQSSPTSVVVLLDLPPRRDLVLHPDYLKAFYEDTPLEGHRLLLDRIPGVEPYVSPLLYIRAFTSPTASVVRVDTTAEGGKRRFEEILRGNAREAARGILDVWLNKVCVLGEERLVPEGERGDLKRRDAVFTSKTIEIDLGSSLPRLFGRETGDRVLAALRAQLGAAMAT